MELRQKLFAKLESLDAILSPSSIIVDVINLIDEKGSSSASLSQIILKDANLTARILKIADSTRYGHNREITEANRAIDNIDRKFIKYLSFFVELYDLVTPEEKNKSKEFDKLWLHLLETAVAAGEIAKCINYGNVDKAFIAGLLHDFGWAFLLRYFPRECDKVNRLLANGASIIDAEHKVLSTDHQEVGRFIAKHWNLPESLAEAIGNHHPVDEMEIDKMPVLSGIVLFADCMSLANYDYPSNITGISHGIAMPDLGRVMIGISLDDIKSICCKLPNEVLKIAEGINLDLGDSADYLSRANERLFDFYLELTGTFREREELTRKFPKEKIMGGAENSLNIALAALSHNINNATMNISGQCEVLQLLYQGGDKDKVFARIPPTVDLIRSSIGKITSILDELSNFNSLEIIDYLDNSKDIEIITEAKSRLESAKATS